MKLLEHMTDEELSEVFAVEVAGWVRVKYGFGWACDPDPSTYPAPHPFATDVLSMLSWLDLRGRWECNFNGQQHWVRVKGWAIGKGQTFARAACIALIESKRLNG